ncbi:MAG: DUF1800 domain-containing protein [Fulvimonas sp.]|mgnify:CR=1 FL=1|nr:DUF1800 domain-containing protein [Fulvimonas sp.]
MSRVVRFRRFACILLSVAGMCVACAGAWAAQPAPLGQEDLLWLRRSGFGIDSTTLARYRDLGRERYLDALLAGADDTLPPAVARYLAALPALSTSPEALFKDFVQRRRALQTQPAGDAHAAAKRALLRDGRRLLGQAQQAVMLHAVYGANPLKEQMVWFWLNHFSVYGLKGRVRLFAADYAEHVIRPHALGKFRDLVMATLESPAMLEFLDNAKNARGHVNENYARELMELHTLGVDAGYTQQDVEALARILTGVGIAPPGLLRHPGARLPPGAVREGLFYFDPRRHEGGDKRLLGQTIHGGGFDEVEKAVDLLVRQPACARFVSRKLAEYFVADQPPPALVEAMARTFQRSDGDIAQVLRTMLTDPAFTDARMHKFTDPVRFVTASMRLALDGQPVSNAAPLVNWMKQMGEAPFGRITPDGWPLDGASWSSSGQLAKRFDIAAIIGSGRHRLFEPAQDDTDEAPPAGGTASRPARAVPPTLDTPLFRQTLAPWLSAATREALAKARNAQEWNTYLLASPDFNTL